MNVSNIPKIYDIIYSGTNANKELTEVWNREAFMNSLRIWLASFSGEVIHNPGRGGFLVQFLMKPMTQVNNDIMSEAIRVGLINDFTPRVTVNYVQVVPNYEKRYWEINVSVYSPDLKENLTLSEKIKSQA